MSAGVCGLMPSGPAGLRTPSAGVFAVTALGGPVVALDVSVANAALLPTIGHNFSGPGRAAPSWVITGYALVFAAGPARPHTTPTTTQEVTR